MYWDDIKHDVSAFGDADLRKAVKERKQLKITRLLKSQHTYVEPDAFYYYAAVAYGLKDQRAIEQLCALKKKNHNLIMGCREWGRWFHADDIEPFTQAFGFWNEKCWLAPAAEMIEHKRNDTLKALLSLRGANGKMVINPLRNNSDLLWETCIQGNLEAFNMLLPISDYKNCGHRCFVTAVYNKHLDIAQKIVDKCNYEGILPELRLNVDEFLNKEAHTPEEIESGHAMYALIDKISITHALEDIGQESPRSSRKM